MKAILVIFFTFLGINVYADSPVACTESEGSSLTDSCLSFKGCGRIKEPVARVVSCELTGNEDACVEYAAIKGVGDLNDTCEASGSCRTNGETCQHEEHEDSTGPEKDGKITAGTEVTIEPVVGGTVYTVTFTTKPNGEKFSTRTEYKLDEEGIEVRDVNGAVVIEDRPELRERYVYVWYVKLICKCKS